ncbi:MAG: 3-oxoacyl-ACP reductase FabG [Candidatus Limiplasma sp.]|nr:3-oxoacyl-ACP reductase FabG [Candidatus Limiplasma sp.]
METALITGGSRGIGAAAVRAFSGAGYRVAFFYHASREAALALSRETGAAALPCDVADSAQVAAACREAERLLGHVDALVPCAGIAQQKLLPDITDQDWDRMLAVNLSGAFYAARAVLPGMIRRKAGRIVFLSSMWGQAGASMEAHYSAAKAGLIGLTKALAKEVAPSGIRVNCVAPGAIDTEMTTALGEEALALLREEIPLGRLGTAQEVAALIVWLCSQQGAYLTGQVLSPNGGMVMG